jgi:hypothetical protein
MLLRRSGIDNKKSQKQKTIVTKNQTQKVSFISIEDPRLSGKINFFFEYASFSRILHSILQRARQLCLSTLLWALLSKQSNSILAMAGERGADLYESKWVQK